MIRIEVIKQLEGNQYEVEFNFDGIVKKAIMDYEQIRGDIVYGNRDIRYFFTEEMQFNNVQIDMDEDGIYHIYLEEYVCYDNIINANDIEHITYKREKSAFNKAYKLAKQYDCNVSLLYMD